VRENLARQGASIVPEIAYFSLFTRRKLLRGSATALLVGFPCFAGGFKPVIEFTRVPPADRGGPEIMDTIEGRVTGARPNQQIVLFAHSEGWWQQPGPSRVYTAINADSTWSSSTHLGTEYAALLVEPGYRPSARLDSLPKEGGPIVAVAVVRGDSTKQAVRTTLQFGGHDWTMRASPSDRGGKNYYNAANAWTDKSGALHLRIAQEAGKWTCAQALLNESLGYGTYRFVVRDISRLDPAAVLAIYVWDAEKSVEQNPREWDIELSRWGNPTSKNAQYVVQPRQLPDHTDRFDAPAGTLTHSLSWEPGKATFRTVHGADGKGPLVYEHSFTSGVPVPANEKLRFNFYDFQRGSQMIQKEAEVIIDRFEFFP
jgi:hypothetical protein